MRKVLGLLVLVPVFVLVPQPQLVPRLLKGKESQVLETNSK